MNRQLLRKTLRFALVFLPLFLVFVAIYVWILPVYQTWVHAAANAITRHLSPASALIHQRDGAWTVFLLAPGQDPRFLASWDSFHWLYLNLAILPALLLATPTRIVERLRLLALGLVLLPPTHVLAVIGLGRGYVCLVAAPGNFACMWLLRGVFTSGQVLAIVLWLLLTRRHWMGSPTSQGTGPA